jgi:putative transposase
LLPELVIGLTEYFVFYNTERPHQSLNYRTPDNIHQTASSGGAKIVVKYRETEKEKIHAKIESKNETKPGQRCSAVDERLPS